MATNREIIKDIEHRGVIDFKVILDKSRDRKQFKAILKHFKISNSDINRFISDAELYEPKLRKK